MDQVKQTGGYLSEADKSMYYGLTSVPEFVSMLMTDQTFREFMNNTSYEGNKSILDRFLDILANILKSLGMQVRDNSVLKEGVTNIVGLIESRKETIDTQDSAPERSITTKSPKVKLVEENFENILDVLNIKTQC
jgi:hypothetical protein